MVHHHEPAQQVSVPLLAPSPRLALADPRLLLHLPLLPLISLSLPTLPSPPRPTRQPRSSRTSPSSSSPDEPACATSSSTRVRRSLLVPPPLPSRPADAPSAPLADSKIVYRRYASLFFVCGIGAQDNELITLEVIHRCARLSPSLALLSSSSPDFKRALQLRRSARPLLWQRLRARPVRPSSPSSSSSSNSADPSLLGRQHLQLPEGLRRAPSSYDRALSLSLTTSSHRTQILDELIIAGEMQESSKKSVLRAVRPALALSAAPRSCEQLTNSHLISRTHRSARQTRSRSRSRARTRPPCRALDGLELLDSVPPSLSSSSLCQGSV